MNKSEKSDIIKILLFIVLSVLAITNAWLYKPWEKTDYPEHGPQIEKLHLQNDSLKADNRQLDQQISHLITITDSLKELIEQDQQNIIQLKKRRHEKIKTIHHYNNVELFRFFAELNTDSTTN